MNEGKINMRLFKYMIQYWKHGLSKLLVWRLSAWISGFVLLCCNILQFVFVKIVFNDDGLSNTISQGIAILIIGFWQISRGFYEVFFETAHDSLEYEISHGNLDFHLLKPIPTFFVLSIREISISNLIAMPFSIYIVVSTIIKLKIIVTLLMLLYSIISLFLGIVLIYLLFNLFNLVSFFSEGLSDSHVIADSWVQLGSRPRSLFRGIIRTIIDGLIPVVLILNLPASIVIGVSLNIMDYIRISIGFFVLLSLNIIIWKYARKFYSGASG